MRGDIYQRYKQSTAQEGLRTKCKYIENNSSAALKVFKSMEIKRFATSYNYGFGRDGDGGNQQKCKHTIYI
jgi:hypothetical protein